MIAAQTIVGREGRLVYCDLEEFGFSYTCDVCETQKMRQALVSRVEIPKFIKRQALRQIADTEDEIFQETYQRQLEQDNTVSDLIGVGLLFVFGIVSGVAFLIWWALWCL